MVHTNKPLGNYTVGITCSVKCGFPDHFCICLRYLDYSDLAFKSMDQLTLSNDYSWTWEMA